MGLHKAIGTSPKNISIVETDTETTIKSFRFGGYGVWATHPAHDSGCRRFGVKVELLGPSMPCGPR